MTSINTATSATYRMPPLADHLYVQAARDFATIGEGLLLIHDAPLLAVSLPGNGRQKPYLMVMWDTALAPCMKRTRAACEGEVTGPVLSALCLAAAVLHARLAACQPAGTDLQGLAAVTDGTGVIFGQMGHLADGLLMTGPHSVSVLPMAADGPWPLFTADLTATRVH